MFSLGCNLLKSDVKFLPVEISSSKVRANNMDFSTIRITLKKVSESIVHFSTIEITSRKVRGNNVDILPSQITPTNVRGNDVNFPTIEITSKIVRGNDVDFFISDITSKKYVEMTWKFFEIWSSAYQRNIHLESTSIRRGVPVGICPENMMT